MASPVLPARRRGLVAALLLATHPGLVRRAVAQDGPAALLTVTLADGRQRRYTLAELQALPQERAPAQRRDGSRFDALGVSVTSLLKLSGLDLAQNLGGGQVVGHALVARAADGYRAVFGLAEVDPHFGHPPLIVSWALDDGRPLPPGAGPLQLVSTGESRPGRWVRQLVALDVKAL
jgi:pimeloyl-ACP methyl ester carboxylesterase